MNRKKLLAQAEAECAAWKHPEGTAVRVVRDSGEVHEGKTRSAPWVIGETAVILVTGISGGYRLSRVTPVTPC